MQQPIETRVKMKSYPSFSTLCRLCWTLPIARALYFI